VHGIVVDSGGRIELESELGRGTRFIMHWPRAAHAPEPDNLEPVAIEGAERAVLVVEDNDGARVFVERLLHDRGFQVEAARNAEEALELTARRNSPPDLVLCDVIMPGLSGPQLVAKLKARWPSLCCLFMSGYIGDVGLGDDFDAAKDLVLKPFTATELLERVAHKLGVHC
jgi:CheY-like chemotaxis protein